jgi:hypothetical protein
MLQGVKHTVDACVASCFYKTKRIFSDHAQTFVDCIRIFANMSNQFRSSHQILGLGERAENCLDDGSVLAKFFD